MRRTPAPAGRSGSAAAARIATIVIDRVTVHGLPAAPQSGAAVGRQIEQALGRRIALGLPGLAAGLSGLAGGVGDVGNAGDVGGGGGSVGEIVVRDLRLPAGATDAEIGEAVAAALGRALGGGRESA